MNETVCAYFFPICIDCHAHTNHGNSTRFSDLLAIPGETIRPTRVSNNISVPPPVACISEHCLCVHSTMGQHISESFTLCGRSQVSYSGPKKHAIISQGIHALVAAVRLCVFVSKLIHARTHPPTHPPTQPPTHPPNHSTPPPTHSFTHPIESIVGVRTWKPRQNKTKLSSTTNPETY